MKITDNKPLSCEQFSAKRASEHLEREQEYERKARLARQTIDECEQEKRDKEADQAAFWKVVYILAHVAAALVLFTIYGFWGKS
ncbi:hypothetical protein [Psychrobacter sp. AOP7-B1-24]|uniref:hypothetical protein n=1 Tax=Psychrobacter sp. AOP7-B1-24 TaxID=3457645 RepID=UPI00402BC477